MSEPCLLHSVSGENRAMKKHSSLYFVNYNSLSQNVNMAIKKIHVDFTARVDFLWHRMRYVYFTYSRGKALLHHKRVMSKGSC